MTFLSFIFFHCWYYNHSRIKRLQKYSFFLGSWLSVGNLTFFYFFVVNGTFSVITFSSQMKFVFWMKHKSNQFTDSISEDTIFRSLTKQLFICEIKVTFVGKMKQKTDLNVCNVPFKNTNTEPSPLRGFHNQYTTIEIVWKCYLHRLHLFKYFW